MTRNSSTSSSNGRLLSVSFLWVIGLIILLEIIGRTFFANNISGRFEYGYHPTSGFIEKDDTLNLVRAGGRRFHPQSIKIHKPDDVFRAFVVGDSVPRGPSLKGAYANQLEQILKGKGVKAEVLNMAIPGFGSRRLQVLLNKALEYEPDLIIFHLNDSSEFEDEREGRRAQEFKGWHPKNWLMKSFILRRLYEMKTERLFWKKLPDEVRIKAGATDADTELEARLNDKTIARWHKRLYRVNRETILGLLDKGVKVVILVQTSYLERHGGSRRIKHRERFAAQWAVNDKVHWRAMADTIDEPAKAAPLYSDPTHMRSAGHRVLAEGLAKFLQDNQLIELNKMPEH